MHTRVHIIVRGLVQGVGYRWFVARHAERLGLAGHVRNLPDGRVEVDAEGERETLEELAGHCRTGPRSARVTDLVIEWDDAGAAGGPRTPHFDIR